MVLTMNFSSTIAAIATPMGAGGISVIRISGGGAFAIADRLFSPVSAERKPSDMKGYTCAYGRIVHNGEFIDEAVLTVFRAPHSYTGEDTVEISCHGGVFITKRILRAVFESGAVPASAGEFTRRAFENGKMTLTQAEAVADVIAADCNAVLRRANNVKDGMLYERAEGISGKISDILARLCVWTDYPDDDAPEIDENMLREELSALSGELSALIGVYDNTRIIRNGIQTVIAGKPNTGKSTLMNALSGSRRSIVTDIAGTTRDIIEESVRLGDITLALADTAGIRENADTIEQIGIDMANQRIDTADLILAVFDGSDALDDDDMRLIERCGALKCRRIAVINKTDLPEIIDRTAFEKFDKTAVISAKENSFEELTAAVTELFADVSAADEIIINERQRQCLITAKERIDEALSAVNSITLDAVTIVIDEALAAMLELSGKRVTENVVDSIFSKFCVGK